MIGTIKKLTGKKKEKKEFTTKSKVEVNPLHIDNNLSSFRTESIDTDILKVILEAKELLEYQLSDIFKSALEIKAIRNDIPYDILESRFKSLIKESKNTQEAFIKLNSLISSGLAKFLSFQNNINTI